MLVKGGWTGLMGFRLIERRETMFKKCRARITGRDRENSTARMSVPTKFTATSTPTAASFSPTWIEFFSPSVANAENNLRNPKRSQERIEFCGKNFNRSFAVFSLGIAFLGISLLGFAPFPACAASNSTSVKRDAASNQFGHAEEMREALNTKSVEKRTLAEYKQVVNAYRRGFFISPHATQMAG